MEILDHHSCWGVFILFYINKVDDVPFIVVSNFYTHLHDFCFSQIWEGPIGLQNIHFCPGATNDNVVFAIFGWQDETLYCENRYNFWKYHINATMWVSTSEIHRSIKEWVKIYWLALDRMVCPPYIGFECHVWGMFGLGCSTKCHR